MPFAHLFLCCGHCTDTGVGPAGLVGMREHGAWPFMDGSWGGIGHGILMNVMCAFMHVLCGANVLRAPRARNIGEHVSECE